MTVDPAFARSMKGGRAFARQLPKGKAVARADVREGKLPGHYSLVKLS